VKIPDVRELERIALDTANVTVQHTHASVRMGGLEMDAIFLIVLEIQTVQTEVSATQQLTHQSARTVHVVGWALLVRTFALMEIKYLWTVETAFAIHVTRVVDAT